MSYLIGLLTMGNTMPDAIEVDEYELRFDLELPAGDALWLQAIETIPVGA